VIPDKILVKSSLSSYPDKISEIFDYCHSPDEIRRKSEKSDRTKIGQFWVLVIKPSQNSGELARMIMNRVDKLISFDMKIKGRTLLDIIELYITHPNHANDSISFAHI
jgi:hypothetical protein